MSWLKHRGAYSGAAGMAYAEWRGWLRIHLSGAILPPMLLLCPDRFLPQLSVGPESPPP